MKSVVLSEHKQLRKKSDACQYIRSVHSVLKRQQPNKLNAVCVSNLNQTTKDRDNHSLLLNESFYNFNKKQRIFDSTSQNWEERYSDHDFV